jgi:hypothetical protein
MSHSIRFITLYVNYSTIDYPFKVFEHIIRKSLG